MRVALFVPCFVDQLAPEAGLATLDLLEAQGLRVDFPPEQACCGQPLWSVGDRRHATPLVERFVRVFEAYDHVVAPSGSCVATLREALPALADPSLRDRASALAARTRELCAFLVDVLGVERVERSFPHRVGVHHGCHALRELGQGPASEGRTPRPDPMGRLLASLDGIELVPLERVDECCGFGGTFVVREPAVASRMGLDRLADHVRAGAEVVTSGDASCLLHLEGLIRREGLALRVMHVAEILAGRSPAP